MGKTKTFILNLQEIDTGFQEIKKGQLWFLSVQYLLVFGAMRRW